MKKLFLVFLTLPSMVLAEKCQGYISFIDHRSDGVLVYFKTAGYFRPLGTAYDVNTDPSGATGQNYVRIEYPSDSVRENQLLSIAMTALSNGHKIFVEYTNAGSPAWNATSLAITN